MTTKELDAKLRCPKPHCGGTAQVLRFNHQDYLQCSKCKFWCTKFTPENPGTFKGGK